VSGITAVILAFFAWQTAEQVARVQIFLDLRKSHAEVQARMDPRYHEKGWDPTTDRDAMRTLERYWLHTFTEWFATTRLNSGKFRDVWNDFYAKAILGGLRNQPLRITLC